MVSAPTPPAFAGLAVAASNTNTAAAATRRANFSVNFMSCSFREATTEVLFYDNVVPLAQSVAQFINLRPHAGDVSAVLQAFQVDLHVCERSFRASYRH